MSAPIPYETLQNWKQQIRSTVDPFVINIPKIELHVHIEGTLTPELRWKLGQRNNVKLRSERLRKEFHSLEELREMYNLLEPRSIKGANYVSAFFDAFNGGMEVLQTEEDFYELAMDYFKKAANMQVRYCEVFFDPQAHTRRGVALELLMAGLRRAQIEAEKDLNVRSQWIMCFLRDLSPADAMNTYISALPFKDMIIGIGLDSKEHNRPPSLFEEVYRRARADGFKLTCHCDVTEEDTHEHIRQVVESIAGTGADRLDHGLDAGSSPSLITLLKSKDIGITLCPWAYVRHHTEEDLFTHFRTLYDAGLKITISSDSPTYVEDNWVTQNLLLLKLKSGFTDKEIVQLERNAVEVCWATQETKVKLLQEIKVFWESFSHE